MKPRQKDSEKLDFQKTAYQVSILTIIVNVALAGFKFLAGIIAHSNAMLSDAVHSASDVFSTIVVIGGIKLSSKASAKEHPYGHERMECIAAILLAAVLFLTGLMIGWEALRNILRESSAPLKTPGLLALAAAILSIAVKEAMYWYTRYYARKLDSTSLMADAWHHRSDALSSIGALAGIAGARMGYPVLDSVASFGIFLFIVKAAYDIFKDAVDKLVDHSCDSETEQQIYDYIAKELLVESIDLLQTRMFGSKIYVDMEIGLDGQYTLQEAHAIANDVHDKIEQHFPRVKHIMIHVNPLEHMDGG